MSFNLVIPKILPGNYGNISIVHVGNHYAIFEGSQRWMATDDKFEDARSTLYSQYDLAHGDVLLSGLGFGILAMSICAKPEVSSVTVLEKSSDVIHAFTLANGNVKKLSILNEDASSFVSNQRFDALLPDHYESQDMHWKLADMASMASRISHNIFWPWSIEYIFIEKHFGKEVYRDHKPIPESLIEKEWKIFISDYFPGVSSITDIGITKVSEYVNQYIRTMADSILIL